MDSAHQKEDGPTMREALSPLQAQATLKALQSGPASKMKQDIPKKTVPGKAFNPNPLGLSSLLEEDTVEPKRPKGFNKPTAEPSQSPVQHNFFMDQEEEEIEVKPKKVTPKKVTKPAPKPKTFRPVAHKASKPQQTEEERIKSRLAKMAKKNAPKDFQPMIRHAPASEKPNGDFVVPKAVKKAESKPKFSRTQMYRHAKKVKKVVKKVQKVKKVVKKKVVKKVAPKPKKKKDTRTNQQKMDDFADSLFQDNDKAEEDQTVNADFAPNPLNLNEKKMDAESDDEGLDLVGDKDEGEHVLSSGSLPGQAVKLAAKAQDFTPLAAQTDLAVQTEAPVVAPVALSKAPKSVAKKVWPAKGEIKKIKIDYKRPARVAAKQALKKALRKSEDRSQAILAEDVVRSVLNKPEPKPALVPQKKVKPLKMDGDKILAQFDEATNEAEQDMEQDDSSFDKPTPVPEAVKEQKVEKALEAHNADIVKSLPKFVGADEMDYGENKGAVLSAFMPSPLQKEEKTDVVKDELNQISDVVDGKKKAAYTVPLTPIQKEQKQTAGQMHASIWGDEHATDAPPVAVVQQDLVEPLEEKKPVEDQAAMFGGRSDSQFFESPPSMLHKNEGTQFGNLRKAESWDNLANSMDKAQVQEMQDDDDAFTPLAGSLEVEKSAMPNAQSEQGPTKQFARARGRRAFKELFG